MFRKRREKKQRTRIDYIRIAVFGVVLIAVMYTLISQQLRIASIRKEKEQCNQQIAAKEKEYEKLSEKAEYSASDDFYEQKARDEGYVRSNETVFVVVN